MANKKKGTVREIVSRISPSGFLSIGMYDRQPNWSHASATCGFVPASVAVLDRLPLIPFGEKRRSKEDRKKAEGKKETEMERRQKVEKR